MKAKEIRELTTAEIEQNVKSMKEELFNLRFQLATGQLEKTARIKTVKTTIASLKNVVRLRVISVHNNNKSYTDRDLSDDMDKTITVEVETYKVHTLYGKRVRYSKKMKTHDENNVAKNGDIVRIMETRPLSKTKHFRLVEVVE